jgi:hypothetical protein
MRANAMKTSEPGYLGYRVYLYSVVLAGLGLLCWCSYQLSHQGPGYGWIVLASLTAVTGSLAIKIPGANSRVSVGEVLIITSLLLFGPAAGCVTAGLDGLFGSLRCKTRSRRLRFLMFNTAVMGVSAFVAGQAFAATVRGRSFRNSDTLTLDETLLPLLVLVAVYYLLNTLGVAAVLGLEKQKKILDVWRRNYLWLPGNYATAGLVALLLVLNGKHVTVAVVGSILTALSASYLVCRSYLGKLSLA